TPRIDGLGVFQPDAGAAGVALGGEAWGDLFAAGAPVFGGHPLVAHDAKPLIAAWLDARTPPPVVDDSAVAAYLLNPARATYKLDEVCMEVFGECPPALLSVAPDDLPRVLGDRARWLARFWEHARKDLDERGLGQIYAEIERPLVPVLAEMERAGIRVDPARLEAYADTLPGLVNPDTGRIHTTFNQLVASTGRLSSQDPNLMNIPIRTELGRRIRAAFIPAEGWTFVAADYSQIELRILAHMSAEAAIIESFRRGEDIHTRTASEVFKIDPREVTSLQRTIAKSANFAILYGVSAFGLSQATKIDQKEAQRYISAYFATHPRVRAFIDRTLQEGRDRGWVQTLLGRRRYLPDLRSGNPDARNAAERMAMNAPVQGTASVM